MANFKNNLTASNIKYILAMYDLNNDNSGTQCVQIAESLKLSKPSVHAMMNTLKEMELVTKSRYGKVFFTDEGLSLAQKYNRYYKVVSGLLRSHLCDERDVSSATCAVLSEISDNSLAHLCEEEGA